ncbi:MAG: thiamine phosphate synthase [Alphaproteobacteria bacterium]|nr:thiamine phosphate synthase [Alphaproteobacteria bacterium]
MTLANEALKLNSAWRRRHTKARQLPALFLMTDPIRLPDPLPVLRRLPSGAGVIFRCYADGADAPGRLALARRIRTACRARRQVLLIAGDDALAHRVRADGIHLAEWRLARGGWKRGQARARRGLITGAAHGPAALHLARRAGIDAVLLAPVFATQSHPGAKVIGRLRFAMLARRGPLPVYALGGIGPATVRRLRGSGAGGLAGIGGFGGPQT